MIWQYFHTNLCALCCDSVTLRRNKLVQITYALANVYDDSPDLDVRVTDDHRTRAEEMMACVESGDVTRLREIFLEVREQQQTWPGSSGSSSTAALGRKVAMAAAWCAGAAAY